MIQFTKAQAAHQQNNAAQMMLKTLSWFFMAANYQKK